MAYSVWKNMASGRRRCRIILQLCFVITAIIIAIGAFPPRVIAGLNITVIYDNSPYLEDLTPDWGFSCLINIGRNNILFDTGKDGSILFSNAKALGIDLKTIDAVVISHLHRDHSGGLFPLLEIQPNATVFLPESTAGMRKLFQEKRTKYITVERPLQIGKGVFLTGRMGKGVHEQSMIINTPLGLIIIAGCSHPGIVNIIKKSKEILRRPVYLVIGGFHTMPGTIEGMAEVIRQFRKMGVRNVSPAHCTDEKIKAFFKAAYGENYITTGAGRKLNFFGKKTNKLKRLQWLGVNDGAQAQKEK